MSATRIKQIFLLIFIFLLLVFIYSRESKNIDISYWDEVQWVGQSYLFQFYISGNFDQNIWNTFNSLDQPTLAKLSYGAWIYPHFIRASKNKGSNFDYTKYLMNKGFFFIDANLPEYQNYHNSLKKTVPEIKPDDSGQPEYYLKKYGSKIKNTLDTIYLARKINFIYLAFAVLILSCYLFKQKGLIFTLFFTFFYGLNSLIMRNGIQAHSDGLFLFLFNASIVLLFLFFEKRKTSYLILFSVLTGLTMSTKLNGIMLYFVFLGTLFLSSFAKIKKITEKLKLITISSFFTLTVFILFNPFTFSQPLEKIVEMYKFRSAHTTYLSQYFPEVALITPLQSLIQTFSNFFGVNDSAIYNAPYFIRTDFSLGIVMLIFFLLGMYSEIKLFRNIVNFPIQIFLTFFLILTITSFYLKLNWDRYFMHLVFFFIYYQVCGIILIVGRLNKIIFNKANLNISGKLSRV